MLKRISVAVLCLTAAAVLSAQEGSTVSVSAGPPPNGWQVVYVYTGGNLDYRCFAKSFVATGTRAVTSVTISAGSNANPVSLTSTAHGFDSNSRPLVIITGGTGNWTAINGTWIATVTGANTFTIPVNSTSFGAFAGSVRFTTTAPRIGQAEWAVQKFAYDVDNNLVGQYWLNGSTGVQAKCTDGALTTTNLQ